MWVVKHFMTMSTAALLASGVYLKNKYTSCKLEGMPPFRKEVVNNLLKTYATIKVIADTEK